MSAHHSHDAEDGHNALPIALVLTLSFAGIEAAAGWWAGSLALLGDAGHMLTDSLALALATLAARVARTPPSHRHSFGLARIEVLAALVNAGFMLALVLGLSWNAVARLAMPRPVAGEIVTWVAAAGLALNIAVAWILMRGTQDLNTRGALLHVMGDAFGSVAALASGLIVSYTGWMQADPLLTLVIGALILASTLRLAREALHTLLEGVPVGISLPDVGKRMASVNGVLSVHDLHIWSLGTGRTALSAHVVLRSLDQWQRVLGDLRVLLHDEFGIEHVTLQPETVDARVVTLGPLAATLRRDR